MPWKAIACSATGTSHEKIEKPCQDYADFIKVNASGDVDDHGDILIGALCDGAGSCKYSDIGSQLAVKTVLKLLRDWLKWLQQQRQDLSRPISQAEAHQVFTQITAKVKEEFAAKAQQMSCKSKDLSCTLLSVVATPQWLAAMQIGDGFIVIRQPDLEYQLLFQSQKGEYANQTTFITASNALEKMESKVVPGQQQFIFASTDGLERLALEIRQQAKPHPPFFDDFRDAIKIRSEDEEKISTQEWLNSDKVNKRTDDDKTILLGWYDAVKVSAKPANSLVQSVSGVQSVQPTPSSVTSEPQALTQTLKSEDLPEAAAVHSGKEEDSSIEVGALVINVLAGIFWNSLYHDLWIDFSFNSLPLRNLIGLIIAGVMAGLILLVDWQLYQQKIKQYSPEKWRSKGHLFLYMAIVYLVGLGLGGLFYYLLYTALSYLSYGQMEWYWKIQLPNR